MVWCGTCPLEHQWLCPFLCSSYLDEGVEHSTLAKTCFLECWRGGDGCKGRRSCLMDAEILQHMSEASFQFSVVDILICRIWSPSSCLVAGVSPLSLAKHLLTTTCCPQTPHPSFCAGKSRASYWPKGRSYLAIGAQKRTTRLGLRLLKHTMPPMPLLPPMARMTSDGQVCLLLPAETPHGIFSSYQTNRQL